MTGNRIIEQQALRILSANSARSHPPRIKGPAEPGRSQNHGKIERGFGLTASVLGRVARQRRQLIDRLLSSSNGLLMRNRGGATRLRWTLKPFVMARCRREANGRSRRILLKNPLFWRQHLGFVAMSARQIPGSSPHVAKMGVGIGMSFASFRRFWAVAASRNSSLAPLGPRKRNRSSRRMRFR